MWTEAIVGALTCVFATVVLMLFEASAHVAPETANGSVTLRHGVAFRAFGWLVTLLSLITAAALLVEAVSSGFDGGTLGAGLGIAAFAAIGCWMVREGRKTFVLDGEGIQVGAPRRTLRTIAWKDVRAVDYSGAAERLIVRDVHGSIAKISRYMRGLDELWSLLEQHVDPRIWSAASHRHRGTRTRTPAGSRGTCATSAQRPRNEDRGSA